MQRTLHIMFLVLVFCSLSLAQAADQWSAVAKKLGKEGKLSGEVYKVSFPRTDLHVRKGDTTIQPALALGSWAAFHKEGAVTVVDGDLVLLTQEMNPVISALQAGGLRITGIHNHLIGENPRLMYVHFFGVNNNAEQLADAVHSALGKTATPMSAAKSPAKKQQSKPAWQATLEKELRSTGTANGEVVSFNFARPEAVQMEGHDMPGAMGMATAINFQPSPKGVAATGDFVLISSEVNPVIRALRDNGIEVEALHNHLLDDTPDLFFVHFWGEGTPEQVAKGLRQALDKVKTK